MTDQADETEDKEAGAGASGLQLGNAVLTVVAAVLGGIVSGLVTGALEAPWYVSLGVSVFFLCFTGLCFYYWLLLSSANAAQGSRDRQNYLDFRKRLEAGGAMGRAYDGGVKGLLSWSERFFGDAGERKPIWTAASFDRCLLIALVYPLVVLISIWVITGDVGLAEQALGLEPDRSWRWLVPVTCLPILVYAFWERQLTGERLDSWRDSLTHFGAIGLTVIGVSASAGTIVSVAAAGLGTTILRSNAGVDSIAACVGLVCIGAALSIGIGFSPAAMSLVFGFAPYFIVRFLRDRLPQKVGNVANVLLFVATLFIALPMLFTFTGVIWRGVAVIAILLPILTLINAPFDWLSLGITRKLMRSGLGKANWQPLLYSFADLILALACLVALGAAMILVIQTFNARLIMEGGSSIYDPGQVLRAIADPEQRWESQYWWIYATLFSTFIPSFLNLLVGSMAIARGVTPINSWMLTKLPLRSEVTRLWLGIMPALLALLRTATIALAGAALAGFLYGLAVVVLPLFSINLLDMLITLADADWPRRLLIG